MSFALTTPQILDRSKSVTRRTGWAFLKPGDLVRAIEKGRGLKNGESVRPLAVLRIVSVRQEPLHALLDDLEYGISEVEREGFSGAPLWGSPTAFIAFFQNTHAAKGRPTLGTPLTRIEFSYVDDPVILIGPKTEVIVSLRGDQKPQ
jgi:hypothetical protein